MIRIKKEPTTTLRRHQGALTDSDYGTIFDVLAVGNGPRLSGEQDMNNSQVYANRNALHATMCSFLGLSARDLAEVGGFSDRFARDLLAGRRPFPSDVKRALEQLLGDFDMIVQATILDAENGHLTVHLFRTNEQLRAAPIQKIWPLSGKSGGGFVGLYRAAVFAAWRKLQASGIELDLVFANTPEVSGQPELG